MRPRTCPPTCRQSGLLIQPLTATIAAWILFGEAVGVVQMAGGALLLWGIYLSRRGAGADLPGTGRRGMKDPPPAHA